MSKGGSSQTTTEIPKWLEQALMPLLQNSTRGLQHFQSQGQNVLQGLPYAQGLDVQPNKNQSFNEALTRYYNKKNQRGGANIGAVDDGVPK